MIIFAGTTVAGTARAEPLVVPRPAEATLAVDVVGAMGGRAVDAFTGVEEAMAARVLTLPPLPIVDQTPPATEVDTLAGV